MSTQAQPASNLICSPVSAQDLPGAVEALLLTSDRPQSAARLAQALGLEPGPDAKRSIAQAISDLNDLYSQSERSFRIESVAGGFRAVALARFAPLLAALHGISASQTLSRPAIELLAIIAYRQPVTRAQIEAIRGVSSGELLRALLDKRLIDITGRAEELGRPMLYGTNRRFLETFGLASIKDLPPVQSDTPPQSAPAPDPPTISGAAEVAAPAQPESTS